jgi:hypothetical protein
MVVAAEQQRVGEARGAAIGPGLDVVSVAEPLAAAREAAAAVAMLEGAAGAGEIAWVRRPTSRTRPSAACRITTRAESQASRLDVSAETWLPSASQDEPPSGRLMTPREKMCSPFCR